MAQLLNEKKKLNNVLITGTDSRECGCSGTEPPSANGGSCAWETETDKQTEVTVYSSQISRRYKLPTGFRVQTTWKIQCLCEIYNCDHFMK